MLIVALFEANCCDIIFWYGANLRDCLLLAFITSKECRWFACVGLSPSGFKVYMALRDIEYRKKGM